MTRRSISILSLILVAISSRGLMAERASAQSAGSSSSSSSKSSSEAKPSPDPENVWTREDLSGDWGGTRKKWEEHGVSFELSWTGFFQGTASGGLETSAEYGGKLTGVMTLDTGKLGWWKNGK